MVVGFAALANADKAKPLPPTTKLSGTSMKPIKKRLENSLTPLKEY